MAGNGIARRLGALLIALSFLLAGPGPGRVYAAAAPDSATKVMDEPGMAASECATMTDPSGSGQEKPCRDANGFCYAGVACSPPLALVSSFTTLSPLSFKSQRLWISDNHRTGLTVRPSFPPPLIARI